MNIQSPCGYVYFATFATPRDAVKVGWSEYPWWRIVQLGHELGAKLRLLGTIEVSRGSRHWGVGYESLESRIHRELFLRRVDPHSLRPCDRGEWYGLSEREALRIIENVRRNIAREAA